MLILLALLLQAGPAPATVDTAMLERVRRNLERQASSFDAPAPDLRVYRVEISERRLVIERPWEQRNIVPPYIHPAQPIYHHDFLYDVTPEAFRSATLFPVAVPLMPAVDALQDAVRRGIRSYRTARETRGAASSACGAPVRHVVRADAACAVAETAISAPEGRKSSILVRRSFSAT